MIVSLICLVSALVLMLLFMPSLLKKLRALKFGQTIYDLGPKAHLNKQGTPNMGGLLIGGITLLAAVVTLLIYWGKQGGSFIGMYTILVKPINPKEEIQIVLKRILERPILWLYRHSRSFSSEHEIPGTEGENG